MKDKIALVITRYRRMLFLVTLTAAFVCTLLMFRVPINTDMTVYLPESSRMKQGVDIIKDEFQNLSLGSTIRVMFDHVPEEKKNEIAEGLGKIRHVTRVSHSTDAHGEKDGYSLYTLTMDCDYGSEGEKEIERTLEAEFSEYGMVYADDDTSSGKIPWWIIAVALMIILAILIFMSSSYVEPFLFVIAIGFAILINMGTNIFLGKISDTTFSIAALLQMVLSMDYSVILMSRYRQELVRTGQESTMNRQERIRHCECAMARAVSLSMSSIVSSALTTVVGLLVLIFMSFRLGGEIGIVLAKGVLISMVCIFTVLPELIIRCDSLIVKTGKKIILPPSKSLSNFEYKGRYILMAVFIGLFAFTAVLKSGADISFTMMEPSSIDEIFPKLNQVVVLYENTDEKGIGRILSEIEQNEPVVSVISDVSPEVGLSIHHLLQSAMSVLLKNQLTGSAHSLMVVSTDLPDEGEEAYGFLDELDRLCSENLKGRYYLIGNTVMAQEMSVTFPAELRRMTLMTAISIFIVVLFTFRSFFVPLLLVLLIQTSVYATMVIMDLQGMSMYYLALLMVQSILMGATIDYAIVFTAYYREFRRSLGILPALRESYTSSFRTILTSGLIIVLATIVLGFAFPNPAIAQICHTIARGASCAILLILLVLPGTLGALGRFVV